MIRYRRSLNHKLCRLGISGCYFFIMTPLAPYWEITSLWVPGGVWSQGWNLKELTEGHHQEWSLRLNLTQHGETHQVQTWEGLTDWELFLDSMGGGAWPFLVGGVICLVNSDNERDLNLLTSYASLTFLIWREGREASVFFSSFFCYLGGWVVNFLEGLSVFNRRKFEAITGLWCP
jgi:hypothetical protein